MLQKFTGGNYADLAEGREFALGVDRRLEAGQAWVAHRNATRGPAQTAHAAHTANKPPSFNN
jgi:hypothetical protein